MRRFKLYLFSVILIFLIGNNNRLLAQINNIDSLVKLYNTDKYLDKTYRQELIQNLEKLTRTNPIKCKEITQTLQETVTKKKDYAMQVHLNHLNAVLLVLQGKFEEARTLVNPSLNLIDKYDLKYLLPRIYAVKGLTYHYQANIPLAMENYNESLKYSEKYGTIEEKYLMQNNLAGLFLVLKDFKKAKVLLEDNMNFYKNKNDEWQLTFTYNNLGYLAEQENQIQKALNLFLLANNLTTIKNNQPLKAQVLNNIGHCYNKMNQIDSSKKYLTEALNINNELKNSKGTAINRVGLSELLYKQKQYQESKQLALMAYKAGIEGKILNIQKEAADQLAKDYSFLNQPDSSALYHDLSIKLADSILNEDNTRQITQMEMKYEFNKKEEKYKFDQQLSNVSLQKEKLQNELSKSLLEKSIQNQQIQQTLLDNQNLINNENQQKIALTKKENQLINTENKSLQQKNELNTLRMKQTWILSAFCILILGFLAYLWWNKARIKQLQISHTLKEQEAQNLIQQNRITESELKAIRSQMNPHFIFNVLNSIESYIVEEDSIQARNLVQKFAKLSRMILENSTQALSSLASEWEINELYTEIEQDRNNHNFDFQFDVGPELNLEKLLIPPMMIQPLIENAIKHGVRNIRQKNSFIQVQIRQVEENQLEIRIQDNGNGILNKPIVNPSYKKQSFGIASIIDRIDILNQKGYSSKADFKLVDLNNQGIRGCISILKLPVIYEEQSA